MKITKEKFEDQLLLDYEEITDEYGPLSIERRKENGGTSYIDRRTNEKFAEWSNGIGTVSNYTPDGRVIPRLKINLLFSKNSLTTAGIYYRIERQAQERKGK